jgi:YfiH family protein
MAIITKKIGQLEILTADGIGAAHGFTTRLGGVSTGSLGSLNISFHRGDREENVVKNYEILAAALGCQPKNMVLSHQIHSDIVRTVTKADHLGFDHHRYPECDALITNDPGTALVVFTADCTPILLWDEKTGAVGAVHAGWRGTAQNIAGKTVEAMCRRFGCEAHNIHAAIGPNIGQCCFETDGEVPQALSAAFGEQAAAFIRQTGEKFYPDLKKINALALQQAGVHQIDISTDCTMCQPDRFWSHRVHGASRGSQGAIILCGEGSL